jgi:hypothetical protein
MGFFKKVFKAVKKAVSTVAKVAAPAVGMYVGGPVGASIGGAISGVASGGGLKGAVIGAGLSYAGANAITKAATSYFAPVSTAGGVAGSIAQNTVGSFVPVSGGGMTVGQVFDKALDITGKVAKVFQVVKAVNSTTNETRYIGIGDIVPSGFTVDNTQAPLTIASPTYENNLGAAQPLSAQTVQAQAAAQNVQANTASQNQLVMVVALGGLAYMAMKKGKK